MTTLMVGLKKQKTKTVTYVKISPKSGEPQRYSWGTQKKEKKKNWRKKNEINDPVDRSYRVKSFIDGCLG